MDDQTKKHSATFPPPVFKSRVVRARMLLEAAGAVWVWDEFEVSGHFVLSDRKAVNKLPGNRHNAE